MRSAPGKSKAFNPIYTQMFIVVTAFVVMGVSSFLFISRIERAHLVNDAENALAFTETEIVSYLLEPETFLGGYSETIRSMLLRGEDEHTLAAYLRSITEYLHRERELQIGQSGTHGYFFTWGGKYISGRNWAPPADFDPKEQPCYINAIAEGGKLTISGPMNDVLIKNKIITISRLLVSDDGSPLAVICLDLEFNRLFQYAINIGLTEGSYGILIKNDLEIIAHRESYFLGQKLYNTDSGISVLSDDLMAGLNVNERKVKNYMYEDSIVYLKKIKYDWYLGIVIPVHEYYRNVNKMAFFLIILGAILAAVLCFMLYQISLAKMKSDLRTQQKSNFLATMSHEIRTPLNAILGMTEIQMQKAEHPPSTSEAFIKINNSGNLLLSIINDILDLSKIEAGKLELIPVKYEVASLINDIIQLNYIRYESKPIEFKIEVDENIPSVLVGDELRIKQILNNLLSNAFKYTDSGTVTLAVNAEYVGRSGGVLATLIFKVSDTGQGMTSDQISKLFDEYTRFNMEANRTTEGAGLGMTITRNLIELMYGKINVKSAVGEGTTVTVRLPQKTDGMGIRGVIGKNMAESLKSFKLGNVIQLKKNQVTYEYMPYGQILIVDDVETNLYVAKGLMVPYGLKIDLATSGFEAIDKVKQGNDYDIIFMDHMMPKMDGIETTKQLRKMGYDYPIVALTANALAGHAEMFLKNDFNDFISKPIDIRQLNATLLKFIRDKQSSEVIEAARKAKAEMDEKGISSVETQTVDPQIAIFFVRDAEKAAVVLENCLQSNLNGEDNLHMYIINVHAMKSALANIGEKELSAAAFRLEQAGREKDINVLISETQDFLSELRKVIAKIKSSDEDGEEIEDTNANLDFLSEKMKIIKDACSLFDKKAAKKAINEIRGKNWSRQTKEQINLISEHLLHSEFETAASLADEYIKMDL